MAVIAPIPNQGCQLDGVQQLQFQVVCNSAKSSRSVLMRADQPVRLGCGVELKILPQVQQPPSLDRATQTAECVQNDRASLWSEVNTLRCDLEFT